MLFVFDLSVKRTLKERFDPLRKSPIMKAVADVHEHMFLPTHDDDALKAHGLGSLKFLDDHFKNSNTLSRPNFDFKEAKGQYLRLKLDMRTTPVFNTDFKNFSVRIVTGFDKAMKGVRAAGDFDDTAAMRS